jgi:hypothetical protein
MTPPCYRHSSSIGAVFGEIAPATLTILYHLGGKTVPIILLCGAVRLTAFTSRHEFLGGVPPDPPPIGEHRRRGPSQTTQEQEVLATLLLRARTAYTHLPLSVA